MLAIRTLHGDSSERDFVGTSQDVRGEFARPKNLQLLFIRGKVAVRKKGRADDVPNSRRFERLVKGVPTPRSRV
jgi:hypothetical protein